MLVFFYFIISLLKGLVLQVVFRNRVFHCNVDSSGNVSLEIIKDGWSPARTITKVLLAIRSILTKPDPCKFFYNLLAFLSGLLVCCMQHVFLSLYSYVSSLSPLFYSWYSTSIIKEQRTLIFFTYPELIEFGLK